MNTTDSMPPFVEERPDQNFCAPPGACTKAYHRKTLYTPNSPIYEVSLRYFISR